VKLWGKLGIEERDVKKVLKGTKEDGTESER
jgi:hypothetical protein